MARDLRRMFGLRGGGGDGGVGRKPIFLRFRSSEAFIVWVVAVAWFTVRVMFHSYFPPSLSRYISRSLRVSSRLPFLGSSVLAILRVFLEF